MSPALSLWTQLSAGKFIPKTKNMDDILNTIQYKEHNINIIYDTCAHSPREDDNLGTVYTKHSRYRPEEEFDDHFEQTEVFDDSFGVFKKSFLKEYIALPLYLYDHSGQSVNTTGFSCRWDTSQFGIIAVPVENIKKEYGWKRITQKRRKTIESYLDGEVKLYNEYLNGQVFGYTITDKSGQETDSCWGYYGHSCIEKIEKECKSIIDYYTNAA